MPPESAPQELEAPHIEVPTPVPARRGLWRVFVLLGVILTLLAIQLTGFRLQSLWAKPRDLTPALVVDRGTVQFYVVESGSLESANNSTVKCKVEALVGLVGGTPGAAGQAGRPGGAGGRGGTTGAGGAAGTGTAYGAAGQQQQQQNQPQAKTPKKSTTAKKSTSASKTASSTSAKSLVGTQTPDAAAQPGMAGGQAAGGAMGGGAAGGAAAGAGAAGGGAQPGGAGALPASNVTKAPEIRSFSYSVVAYVPLRPQGQANAAQTKKTQDAALLQQQQQGGGGRRGNNNNMEMEKPGATRIIWIAPEGTVVKGGDIVCELDSAAFRDEVQAQKIKYLQAQAWVEQARSILLVNEIALREYRDGIYPQDASLIDQYLTTCRIEEERARNNLEWSIETYKKSFRSRAQVRADELALQRARIALTEALGMKERLEKYTAPRLIKALEAKLEANRADKLAQEASFQLESDRLKRLETMVENCTLRAPRDGIVVYANQTNPWGRVEAQIQEGATVREGQAIFNLPDPNRMRVKAKINESKVAFVHTGQQAEIRIDAFPDRPLRGTVAEVTPIPAPSNGPGSDVKIYYAMVDIDTGGFSALRPGLSAEVSFFVESHPKVVRVPVQAIRWSRNQAFAAVINPNGTRWRNVTLGLINEVHAEVTSGLQPGERVVADPSSLPPPLARVTPVVAEVGPRSKG